MVMLQDKTRLRKAIAILGVLVVVPLLAACGADKPRTDGTSADAAKLGTPVAQALPPGDFVVLWILNGTPTQTPTPNPTDVSVWATINAKTPTVPPLNTVAPLPAADSAALAGAQAAPTGDAMGGMAGMDATQPAATQAAAAQPAAGQPAAGNADAGKAVFTGAGGCYACHDTSQGVTIVGPSLAHVAGESIPKHAKPGQSPEQYLYESITNPNAFVVPDFPSGVMPQNFSQMLSEQQINDVIAYLLTLK